METYRGRREGSLTADDDDRGLPHHVVVTAAGKEPSGRGDADAGVGPTKGIALL
jgi:hypothetical protein